MIAPPFTSPHPCGPATQDFYAVLCPSSSTPLQVSSVCAEPPLTLVSDPVQHQCLLPDDGVVVLLCILLTSLSSLSHSSGILVFPQAGLQTLFGLRNVNLGNITIEPVDSICRDSMDMQCKSYNNTKAFKRMYY